MTFNSMCTLSYVLMMSILVYQYLGLKFVLSSVLISKGLCINFIDLRF